MSNPVPEKPKAEAMPIYEILYKSGNMANRQRFYCASKDEAIAIGRKWCEEHKLFFINVYPFTVDLTTFKLG